MRSVIAFRFELAFQMILNYLPRSIYKLEEFKNRKRIGEDCGHEWVYIPKFCVNWVGTVWIKVNQEYQQQLCLYKINIRRYFRCN